MTKTKVALGGVLALAMICGGVAVAQMPKENVSGHKHPNLAAAQRLSREAWEKIGAAQQANEWDMGGLAKNAKALLDQAADEIAKAREAANYNKK